MCKLSEDCTDTRYPSAGEKEGVRGKLEGRERDTAVLKLLSSLSASMLATVSVLQWRTFACLADETEGVLQNHRSWKQDTSVWQMKQG